MKENLRKLGPESLTAVVMTFKVFWDVLPCRTVNISFQFFIFRHYVTLPRAS
jgi:hypothetical protein